MNASEDQTAHHASDGTEWDRIAASQGFQDLLALKRVFIIPAYIFFCVYYFLLPVLVGFAPKLMSRRVIGTINVAYLFALSQFVVGWAIAWLYLKAAAKFDGLTKDILVKVDLRQGEK